MYAPHNREALRQAGTFGIEEDDGVKSLVREDGGGGYLMPYKKLGAGERI